MEIYFTREHEWIRIEGTVGTVGITAYAVEQLGDITFIELPPIGKSVCRSGMLCSVESVKAASDIFAPLTGKVIEVNRTLDTAPEIVNQSPEGEGWISRMEVEDLSEVKNLMCRSDYDEYLRGLA
ncbi:MAG: glycine cleavage system protein GcvH [Geobacteraceae bacterium]|nr:glycine cleavage system protein GcvH [Geobacteraceae bacterium]